MHQQSPVVHISRKLRMNNLESDTVHDPAEVAQVRKGTQPASLLETLTWELSKTNALWAKQ